jgi:hypothetical protein
MLERQARPMPERPIRCALQANFRRDWAAAVTLACPGLEFVTLSPRALGLPDAPNPFGLRQDDQADVILLTSYWRNWLSTHHPDEVGRVMGVLERSARVIVGLDGTDYFELGFAADWLDRVKTVIKFQGVFRDRDLYNYDVGPWHPRAIWSAKLRAKPLRYRDQDLEKIRLSVPCLVIDLPGLLRSARRYETGIASTTARGLSPNQRRLRSVAEEAFSAAVRVAPTRSRRLDVQCLATLTHIQRLEAVRELDGFSGSHGIDRIPVTVAGIDDELAGATPAESRRALLDEVAPYLRPRLGRVRYVRDMCRHRVVVAPTGYGELGQRHGWALRTGSALVCQDLGHVEMMFPFRDRENVAFCRPDLADLREVVQELLRDEGLRRRIAVEGRRSFAAWASQWRSHLEAGIAAPIRESLTGVR